MIGRPIVILLGIECSVLINGSYQYDVNATDSDGHSLIYSLPDSPAGMTINSSSGLINWTAPANTGTYDITVKATDSGGAYATQMFIIVVSATPPAPLSTVEFVSVPAGTFQMGDNIGGGSSDELPVHSVTLSAFQIGKRWN